MALQFLDMGPESTGGLAHKAGSCRFNSERTLANPLEATVGVIVNLHGSHYRWLIHHSRSFFRPRSIPSSLTLLVVAPLSLKSSSGLFAALAISSASSYSKSNERNK